jgi:hypothetical protein
MSEMETDFTAEPALTEVMDELVRREPIFHREEFGRTRADFEAMTTADFWEVGASGRPYSRDHVLDTLERRYQAPFDDDWKTQSFRCRQLADDLYLLTYVLIQGARESRRSTLWRRIGDGWKIEFHQGTLVQPDEG